MIPGYGARAQRKGRPLQAVGNGKASERNERERGAEGRKEHLEQAELSVKAGKLEWDRSSSRLGPRWNQKVQRSRRVSLDSCLPMFTLLYGRVADCSQSKCGWVCAPYPLCCLPEYSALSHPPLGPPTVPSIVPLRSWCSWKLVALILIEILIVLGGIEVGLT